MLETWLVGASVVGRAACTETGTEATSGRSGSVVVLGEEARAARR